MRIARVEIGGGVRAAIVSADASSVRPLPPDVSVLDLLGDGRDAVAARAGDELALESVRLPSRRCSRPRSATSACSSSTSRA